MKATLLTTIKSVTNAGDLCKQRVYYLKAEKMEDAICIQKNVLVKDEKTFIEYCKSGFAVGREFNGKILVQQQFSIKVSSFNVVNNHLQKFIKDEN